MIYRLVYDQETVVSLFVVVQGHSGVLGFAMLASASVQETHDLAIVAHIAALEESIPVLHFFDGWRTSNETATINVTPYEALAPLVPRDKVEAFRRRGLNPEHPVLRGSAQNWDVYFQNREAANKYYDAFPAIVQQTMDKVATVTGRQYHLFDYYGAPDAEAVIVAIGSSTEVIEMTVDHLNRTGKKYGVVKVRLYRSPHPRRLLTRPHPQITTGVAPAAIRGEG